MIITCIALFAIWWSWLVAVTESVVTRSLSTPTAKFAATVELHSNSSSTPRTPEASPAAAPPLQAPRPPRRAHPTVSRCSSRTITAMSRGQGHCHTHRSCSSWAKTSPPRIKSRRKAEDVRTGCQEELLFSSIFASVHDIHVHVHDVHVTDHGTICFLSITRCDGG